MQLIIITMDCKKYITGGLLPLMKLITSTPVQDRCFFEVIPPNTPAKLYFDIDHAGCVDLVAYERFEELFIETVKRRLRTDFFYEDWETPCRPIVLKSNGNAKHSIHYVFPVVFESTALMKEFVSNVVQDLKETAFAKDIDQGVYTAWRNFRMVANTKRGKDNHLIARRNLKGTLHEQLLQCFVSVMRNKVSYAEIHPTLDSLFNCKRVITRSSTEDSTSIVRSMVGSIGSSTIPKKYQKMVEMVEEKIVESEFPDYSYYRTFQQFNGSDFIDYVFTPGLPCPNNGDKSHKSNKTYFKIDIRKGCVFFRCADPECSKDVFGVRSIRSLDATQTPSMVNATAQSCCVRSAVATGRPSKKCKRLDDI